MDYKKFLIQQQTASGTDVGNVVDTYTTYKVVCQEMPFKHLPEVKEPAKRDWYDEHGEDVYIPNDGMRFKAYDVEATFLFVGTQQEMHGKITSFIEFITGRNTNGSPWLAIYDEYTGIGRKKVYVSEVEDEMYFFDDVNTEAIAQFKVKFRVNDPVTDVILTLGSSSSS